jgi:hypothetical protein
LLVPARIPVFISLFFSDWGSGAYLSFFFFFLFSGKGFYSFMDFLIPPASGWDSGACPPSSLFFFSQ